MITHLISSELRRKLLAQYFNHPEERYYVRELAALLDLDPGNLSRELKRLADDALFDTEYKGRIKFYRLNQNHPLYNELKQIIFKTEGAEGALRRLAGRFEKIKTAFIYGSYAAGKAHAASDIDLIIVGEPDRARLTADIRAIEDKLNREINFNLYRPEEFMKKRREKGSFLAQVIRGKKILLKGSLRE